MLLTILVATPGEAFMDKYVEIAGRKALTSPNFVIFHEGRYYVTVAVLEFDPTSAGASGQEGVAAVRGMFESAQQQQSQGSPAGLESASRTAAFAPSTPQAFPLNQSWAWTEQSTDPPSDPDPIG
ncbi:MAG: hypothetical protein ACXWUX_08740 [Allosphingosinicella sp.]